MSTVSPPQCVAAPFTLTQARARLVSGADDVARAALDLGRPELEWVGRARQAYDEALRTERTGLTRLGATLDRCVALLDAFTVVAEEDAARYAAEQAAGGRL